MKITLYVRSVAHVTDGRGRIGVSHPYAITAVENAFVTTRRTDDLLYEPDSLRLLEIIERLPASISQTVEVVDIGTVNGWMKAHLAGIHRAPAVVTGGVRYQGVEEARRAIEGLVVNAGSSVAHLVLEDD